MNRLVLLLSTSLCFFGLQAQNEISLDGLSSELIKEYGEFLKSSSNGNCLQFTATPSSTPVSCNGFDDGQACITVTSGIGPFTYLWLGESSIDSCLSNVDAGAYIVIVTDVGQAASCSWQITVSEPTAIGVIDMNALPPSCVGVCDGQANPLVVGGNGGFMFSYDSGEETQAASMLCDPFELTITDSNGCMTDTVFVFENAPDTIQIDGVVTDNNCFGEDDGAIDITVSGGASGYDFEWTGPDMYTNDTEDISDLAPGDYSIEVTDANGCVQAGEFIVEEAVDITVEAIIVDVLCFADSTGSIDVTVSGGLPDYDYDWTGPEGFTSTDEDIILLKAGEYLLTITDQLGCTKDTSFTIQENPSIIIEAIVTDNLCFADSTGSIDITVNSVIGVSDYNWTGPDSYSSSNEDILDLVAGDYILTVTDNLGCMKDTIITVSQPDELLLDILSTDILCNGDSTGSIAMEIIGGIPDYDINWSGPDGFSSTSEDLFDLVAGDYNVVVLDSNSCQVDTTITILQPLPISLSDTITDVFCASDSTGAIEIEISGGEDPYNTSWVGPGSFTSNDEDIFDLQAGTYGLIITDANLCEVDFSFDVAEPDSILIDFITTDISCPSDSTGAIDITVTGGLGQYSFLWDGPDPFTSTEEDVTQLIAGVYTVQVTDENLCTSEALIEIFEPEEFQLDTLVTHISCPGEDDGEIDLTISGGTGGYNVQWTGPGTFSESTEDIDELGPGLYTAVITDANLCVDSISIEIIEPESMLIMGDVTDVECSGDSTGVIDITVTLGAGGYTYDWVGSGGFTSEDEDLTGVPGGVYVVTVTDANLCTQMATFEVEQNEIIVLDSDITQIECAGDSTGAIDITVIGGQAGFIYSWTGPNGYTNDIEDIENLIAGTYLLEVEDQLGCTEQNAFVISEPDPLSVTATLIDPLCFGEENGDIDILISGGTEDYVISWVGPSGFNESGLDIDIADLEGGTYILNITDFFGCSLDTSFTLNEPDDLEASLDILDPGCDLDNGMVTSTVSGGTVAADYTFYWTNSMGDTIGTDPDIDNLGADTYTFEVIDDNGCSVLLPFELSDDVGSISALIQDVSCFGDMDGAIDVEVTDLTGNLTISWTGPEMYTNDVLDITDLIAGDYTISVQDQLGCELIENYTVGSPDEIIIDANVENESCEDLEDGTIDITVTGGQGELTFSWTDGGTFSSDQEDLTDLPPGSYTVTVTDTSACSNMASFEVLPAVVYSIDADITDIDCAGDESGAIDLTINPALVGATYLWAGPNGFSADTEDIIDLPIGQYDVLITTADFCVFTASYEIDENEPLVAILDLTNSACGMNIGAASLSVTGGEALVDYQYSFYTLPDTVIIGTTNSISGREAGLYGYTVIDDNGCTISGTFTISDEIGTLEADIQGVSCDGLDDGAIDLTITGLTDDLEIMWTGPEDYSNDQEDIFDLAPGFYTVTITDANGCVLGDTYEIEEGVGITISGTVSNVTCFGDDDGAIDIEYSGGEEPFNISWVGPNNFMESQEDISDLEPGDYTVVISDLNDCDGSETFTVEEPELLDVEAFITPVLCNGELSGAIEINILGGTGPFVIEWTGPNDFESSFEDISGLEAGNYSLSIVDFKGCTFDQDYEVTQPESISIELLQLVNSSCDLAIGLIEVNASGGNSPYEYVWENSAGFEVSDQALADDLAADTYTVTVEDEDGCTASEGYIVSNQEAFLSGIVDSVSCNGLNDGAIDLTVTGQITGMADTLWVGPNGFTATTEDIMDLIAGDYTVTIEDEASCVFTETFTVLEPDTLIISGLAEPVNCNGFEDGTINVTVVGGTSPYTYSWTGPDFTSDQEDLVNLEPGTYTLNLTDGNDCLSEFSIDVNEPSLITIQEDTLADPACVGLDNGLIAISVQGGNTGYTYDWTGPDFSSSQQDLTNLAPGTYEVLVTDDSLCTATSSFELQAPQLIQLTADVTDLLCNGDVDGTIDIEATGGDEPLTYNWTGPTPFTSNNQDISGLEAGTYDLIITDDLGCQNDTMIVITEPDTLDVQLVQLNNVSCAGELTGAINIQAGGGVETYTYEWEGPNMFTSMDEDLSGLASGTYELLLTDFNSCQYEATFEVMQPDTIEVTAITQPVNCNGDEDGSINISTSGGIGDYDFSWTGPSPFVSDDEDINDLLPGTYTVTVTDEVPCEVEFSFEVTEPDVITISEDLIENPTCSGLSDGAIEISVSGGNGGYDFQWNGPGFFSTLEDISNLAPGQYDLTIVDDSSCVGSATIILADVQVMDISLEIDSIDCNGDDDASIDLTLTGGNGDFDYDWIGPNPFSSDEEDISTLEPGDYTISIVDGIGCQIDSTITITEPSAISLTETEINPVICAGEENGAITISVEGGTLDYTFDWIGPDSFGSDSQDIDQLAAGGYTLTITDANSCVFSEDLIVNEPLALQAVEENISAAECENTSDGALLISVNGGNSGYSFDWIGPNSFDSDEEDLLGVIPGDYIVNITDAEGCMVSEAFTIPFLVAISVDAGEYPPTCSGEELELNGQGGPAGSDFEWNTPGNPSFSNELGPIVPISITNDVFILTVTNGNCMATDTAAIDVLPIPNPNAGEDQEVFIDDFIELGGDPTWIDADSYSWSPSEFLDDPSSSNPIYDVMGEELFTVIVVGSNGCIGIDEVLITINPNLEVFSGFTPDNGDGVNEEWLIGNVELFPEMVVQVYNRWGDQLWVSDIGYQSPWDGTYEGQPLPVGTYYYVIELNDERFPEPLTGPITIFR